MIEFYSIYIEMGFSFLSGICNDVEVKLFGS